MVYLIYGRTETKRAATYILFDLFSAGKSFANYFPAVVNIPVSFVQK